MSAPKHTPGPWVMEEIKSRGKHVYWRIVAPTRIVAGVSLEAVVYGHKKTVAAEIKANAHLIAAAPTMFTALRRVAEELGDVVDSMDSADGPAPSWEMKLLAEVDNAIAEATGGHS